MGQPAHALDGDTVIRRPHKYHAVKTVVDGITFASKAEAKRYGELKLLEKAGKIECLELQPVFPLRVLDDGFYRGGWEGVETIGKYVADFKYFRLEAPTGWITEEVKGFKTPLYRWKKRHVEAQYGITIMEITK